MEPPITIKQAQVEHPSQEVTLQALNQDAAIQEVLGAALSDLQLHPDAERPSAVEVKPDAETKVESLTLSETSSTAPSAYHLQPSSEDGPSDTFDLDKVIADLKADNNFPADKTYTVNELTQFKRRASVICLRFRSQEKTKVDSITEEGLFSVLALLVTFHSLDTKFNIK